MDQLESMASLFRRTVRAHPERIFSRHVVQGRIEVMSYRDAAINVAAIVRDLDQRGIRRGDRIVYFMADVYDCLLPFLAATIHGVVIGPVDPRTSTRALTEFARRTQAKAILTRREHATLALETGIPVLCCQDGSPAPAGTELLANGPRPTSAEVDAVLDREAPGVDDLYLIQPTSGTTGVPKLMQRTQRPFIRIAPFISFADAAPSDEPLRRLMVSPLTHGGGVMDLWAAIYIAAEMCVPSAQNTDTPLAEVRLLDPHVFFAVPRMLRALNRQFHESGGTERDPFLGKSTRVVCYGGGACDSTLRQFMASKGIEVLEVYGTSETGLLSVTPRGGLRDGWAGKLLPDVDVKLDTDGEILARSPVMMLGYEGDPITTRASYTDDGYYRTGDFGMLDDGWVKILGRKKDTFNTPSGSNIFPARIEGLIEAVPWIRQAVVAGDGRPFLTAMVVIDWNSPAAPARDAPDAAVREAVRQVLAAMNRDLEPEERIRRFAIMPEPFPDDLYRPVGHGKIRRERAEIQQRYAETFTALYGNDPNHAVEAGT